MGVEKGPHVSQWMRSKALGATWLALGKGNLFCLAKGQIEQENWTSLFKVICEIQRESNSCLEMEGFPSLACHRCTLWHLFLTEVRESKQADTDSAEVLLWHVTFEAIYGMEKEENTVAVVSKRYKFPFALPVHSSSMVEGPE